jgi:hypothetical protein
LTHVTKAERKRLQPSSARTEFAGRRKVDSRAHKNKDDEGRQIVAPWKEPPQMAFPPHLARYLSRWRNYFSTRAALQASDFSGFPLLESPLIEASDLEVEHIPHDPSTAFRSIPIAITPAGRSARVVPFAHPREFSAPTKNYARLEFRLVEESS